MATTTSRPGRTLVIFLLAIAAMFATVAAVGNWKPKLGLDLQGGQRITLQAKTVTGGAITPDKLDEAVGIISDRVNGAGVSEAEVSTQGSDVIVIEVPGEPDKNQTESLSRTAQLRFRLVAQALPPASIPTTPSSGAPTDVLPSETPTSEPPSGEPTKGEPTKGQSSEGPEISPPPQNEPTKADPSKATQPIEPKNRVVPPGLLTGKPAAADPSGDPSDTPSDAPSDAPSETPAATTGSEGADPEPTPPAPPQALVPPEIEDIQDPYAWTQSPPAEWQQRLGEFSCDKRDPSQPGVLDIPSQPLLTCDEDGSRYLLGPAMLDGTEVSDASFTNQGRVDYAVNLKFTGQGGDTFGEITNRIKTIGGTGQQLAIVLDGKVLSAPTNDQAIPGGSAEITGDFTQDEAANLANSLKYGALPLSFEEQDNTTVGPELAGDQLGAGVIAGIIGLILVMVYCLIYYRGLGLVVIASLLIAGLITYASVLLLGKAYGFTLTLPGIAGLIVAVGITADSFIVYFERLRDEVRDGKTLRTSVESGWVRARTTILAADAVSLLAAVVLFIFAIGVVKGFAFALGLTTLIDVFVVFFFTKPMVTLLARTQFFGQGHKLSGLDRQHLGLKPLTRTARPARPARGGA